jgi:3-oxoacyl-[acyl-carrier-protein] synthase II
VSEPVIVAWAAVSAAGEGAPDSPVFADLDGVAVSRAVLPIRSLWPGAPDRIGRMDRPAAHGLLVAARALAMAGAPPREDTAIIVGTALGCAEVNERYHRGLVTRGADGASPLLFAQTIPSTPAGEIAIALGLRGHTTTVMAGRASGVAALVEARRALALGRCERALVVVGDTVGGDRVRLRHDRGEAPCAEASVALVLARAGEGAALEHAGVTAGDGDDGSTDWLGASGIVELVAWLARADSPRFEHTVRCASGRVGRLRVRRTGADAAVLSSAPR